ncbi:PorV/PorQ family protein [candidate division KSB1 bacterium]|nr:PorV/PorQ family protein [candidate division KSB1 bacterium]MBL7095753.1 PorV/PorQ family protein [candidate division KSB1 bacterium]
MKKRTLFIELSIVVLLLYLTAGFAADKKLAQTGFQFLSITTDARASAMGSAFTAVPGKSSSIFFNPANMASISSFVDLSLSQNNWIADINHYAGSLAISPKGGHYGVIALSVMSVDYGEFLGTVVDATSEKGFRDTGSFAPTAYAFGIGYARALTDRFSVGGHVRYVSQKLGNSILPADDFSSSGLTKEVDNRVEVMAFDFGTIYRTGFKSLVFGMSVRNFSQEVKYQTEGFQLPLTFNIGISMNVFDLFMEETDLHSLMVSIDALHPRAYSERINIGTEYWFKNMFALRCGYKNNYDERGLTAGFGFQLNLGKRNLAVDYSYTPFGVFDMVQRMSFRLSM